MGEATGPKYKVAFRRRRQSLTNYAKRLALIKSDEARLVVRASNKGIVAQIVTFSPEGDRTVASVNSSELESAGWVSQANTPTAYLAGVLVAKKAKAKGVASAHLDIGMSTPSKGRILFACALGAKAAGLKIEIGDEMVDAKRIDGTHISEFAKKMEKESGEKFRAHFSRYVKKNVDVKELPKLFEQAKAKLMSG